MIIQCETMGAEAGGAAALFPCATWKVKESPALILLPGTGVWPKIVPGGAAVPVMGVTLLTLNPAR